MMWSGSSRRFLPSLVIVRSSSASCREEGRLFALLPRHAMPVQVHLQHPLGVFLHWMHQNSRARDFEANPQYSLEFDAPMLFSLVLGAPMRASGL